MNQFQIDISIPIPSVQIKHQDSVMLVGSCFTEHISRYLSQSKMNILANPNGILFNPLSVANCLEQYVSGNLIKEDELFYLNEIWNHWQFHSRFTDIDRETAFNKMNQSLEEAHSFIKQTDWLIITFGSAYQYYLIHNGQEIPVANCHRAPAQWFDKRLISVNDIVDALLSSIEKIKIINPNIKVILTVSPVRHLRDGVINNNRSKARLLEAVHQIVATLEYCHYFPAYELVIDVLRDYRFYDIDMAHPNYAATQFVWQQFFHTYFDANAQNLIKLLQEVQTAYNHKPRFAQTDAHQKFKNVYAQKIKDLMQAYPYLNFKEELQYFEG